MRATPLDVPAEQSGFSDAAYADFDAVVAKVIALAARDGMEDLHADGAFSDLQAPSLNRGLRGRVYEVLTATRHRDPGRRHDPIAKYMHDLAQGHKGGLARAALQGAVARAVDDFAAAEVIDGDTAQELREAAVGAALIAYKTVDRLSRGKSKDGQDQRAVDYWLRRIPKDWEEPVVSPKFQKLLNAPAPNDRRVS